MRRLASVPLVRGAEPAWPYRNHPVRAAHRVPRLDPGPARRGDCAFSRHRCGAWAARGL